MAIQQNKRHSGSIRSSHPTAPVRISFATHKFLERSVRDEEKYRLDCERHSPHPPRHKKCSCILFSSNFYLDVASFLLKEKVLRQLFESLVNLKGP